METYCMTTPVRKKIETITKKYDVQEEVIRHEYQVCRLARQLFAGLLPVHFLHSYDREMLSFAALLHDTGLLEGQKCHHKKSRDIICQELTGILPPEDIYIIAAVARYHRKALPKKHHSDIVNLSRENRYRVMALASLLRIADGLDYSHQQAVSIYSCICSEKDITIHCNSSDPQMADQIRAQDKSDLASKVFHRPVTIIMQKSAPSPGG